MIVYHITNVAYFCAPEKEQELLNYLKMHGFNPEEYHRKEFNGPFFVETEYTGIPNLYGLTFDVL